MFWNIQQGLVSAIGATSQLPYTFRINRAGTVYSPFVLSINVLDEAWISTTYSDRLVDLVSDFQKQCSKCTLIYRSYSIN